jgi:hypothetical protein
VCAGGFVKAHKVEHTKVRNRLKNKTVHELLCMCIATSIFGSSRRYKTKKDNKRANRVDADGLWEDFFVAALIGRLEDETGAGRSIEWVLSLKVSIVAGFI